MDQSNSKESVNVNTDKTIPTGVIIAKKEIESPLLQKVRHNFGVFGGISLIFGLLFTLLFYKASFGFNVFAFTVIMVILLCIIGEKLSVPSKNTNLFYYAGAILLGLSSMLTSSESLQFLNVIGIIFLLDLSLLHQFYEDEKWDFSRHFGKMFGLLFFSIASLGKPFVHGVDFMKQIKVLKNDKVRNVFIGIVISVPLVIIILALLSSADLLFGEMTENIFQFFFSGDVIGVCFMLVFGVLACYCILCGAVANVGEEAPSEKKKADASIAITVMLILCFVYVIFCGIQIIYLFANGVSMLPQDFTFAEYARRGFFELLAVASINIILMLLEKALFQKSKVVSVLITLITLCTYIMIGSAAYRMLLYISAYHLTFLRVFVLLALLIIALILAGVVIAEYRKQFPLFRYCVVVVALPYLIFSFSRPDSYIAEYLLDHVDTLSYSDMNYLTRELSLDAAPVILPVIADSERWNDENIDNGKAEDSVQEYNNMFYEYDTSADAIKKEYYARINRAQSEREFRDFNYSIYQLGKLHVSK